MTSADEKIVELGLELPPPPRPVAVYRTLTVQGNVAYTSGHGPLLPDGSHTTGRVGADLSLEAGRDAARQTGLAILATLRSELGSLARVRRVLKVLGMVQCSQDFHDQPRVIDGCTELFAAIWGPDHGVAARSAVGVLALPGGIAVEIEAIFEISEG